MTPASPGRGAAWPLQRSAEAASGPRTTPGSRRFGFYATEHGQLDVAEKAWHRISEDEAAASGVCTFQWLAFAGGTHTYPRATVRLTRGDEIVEADATGNGMIDAACNAVAKAAGMEASLVAFRAAVTDTDAIGDVSIEAEVAIERVNARRVSTDVNEASALASLHAINSAAEAKVLTMSNLGVLLQGRGEDAEAKQ